MAATIAAVTVYSYHSRERVALYVPIWLLVLISLTAIAVIRGAHAETVRVRLQRDYACYSWKRANDLALRVLDEWYQRKRPNGSDSVLDAEDVPGYLAPLVDEWRRQEFAAVQHLADVGMSGASVFEIARSVAIRYL